MNTGDLFIEVDYAQQRKQKENVCGDAFLSQRYARGRRLITVLSDGLGSGVKANILATMTTRMALKFAAANTDFRRTVTTMMDALPVCQTRKISYATFTIIDCQTQGETRIIEMDNPNFLLVRNRREHAVDADELTSPDWRNRTLRFSSFEAKPEDRIVFISDGISQAGLGTEAHKLGWRRKGFRDFVLDRVKACPNISARNLAQTVLREALKKEPGRAAHDDMSCGVLYFRRPRKLLVLTGPPYDAARDADYAHTLKNFNGKKAICGGTTADIIARELDRPITMDMATRSRDLPPLSKMDGVDLISEGILTLTKAAGILEEGQREPGNHAAAQLAELLLESDIIEFLVGSRINEAHQDPNLPQELELRRNIIDRLSRILRGQYSKEVSVQRI